MANIYIYIYIYIYISLYYIGYFSVLNESSSSNSISELRGIFEQAESRRNSTEENNNMLRLNHCNSKSIINCTVVDEIWQSEKQETPIQLTVNENVDPSYNRLS